MAITVQKYCKMSSTKHKNIKLHANKATLEQILWTVISDTDGRLCFSACDFLVRTHYSLHHVYCTGYIVSTTTHHFIK